MTESVAWVRRTPYDMWHQAVEMRDYEARDSETGEVVCMARVRCALRPFKVFALRLSVDNVPVSLCPRCEHWRHEASSRPDVGDVYYTAGPGSGCEYRLTHRDSEEAIGAYLANFARGEEPNEVEVTEWRRVVVDGSAWQFLLDPLDGMLEALDKEYNCGDDEPLPPNRAMLEAERVFIDTILREYVPYNCEPVRTWIKEVTEPATHERAEGGQP